MAGACTEQETASDINKLKSVTHCKIMKNVGDFTFLIDAAVPNTECLVKFQLTAEYPEKAPSVFIRHPLLTKDELQKVILSIPADVTRLPALFALVSELVTTYQPEANAKTRSEKTSSPNASRQRKKKSDRGEVRDVTKKPPMRTAADVIKRVQWDSSLSGEAFIVGYIDRFLGIQEQPFNAFNWVNPADADWMDLNIPEHRIEYFKYNDKIVWEKKTRLDNVFGSTGGMTIDQVNSTADPLPADVKDDNTMTEAALTQNDVIEISLDSDDSGTDDDVQVEMAAVTVNPLLAAVTVNPLLDRRAQPSKQLRRDKPNHFIVIPVTDSRVVAAVDGFQDEYITLSEGDGEQYKTELCNLHITLCAVRIDSQSELDTVSQSLYELVLDEGAALQRQFSLDKLGSFWSRVLYAEASLDETFHEFVLKLRQSLAQRGIKIFDDMSQFVPHLTIFKFPKFNSAKHFPMDDFLKIKSDSRNDVIANAVALSEIALLSMDRDDNNQYIRKITLDLI